MSGSTKARVHDEVVRKLGRAILDGTHRPGDRLPNEEALQARYGVSRTSVREAVKFLSAKGMIEARPRVGMIVRGPEAWNLLDPEVLGWRQGGLHDDPELVRSLLEARRVIEPAAAAMAASRASAADLAAIEEGYLGMAANLPANLPSDLAACCKADLAFHAAIIQASGNLVFRHLIATIGAALEASFRLSTGLSAAYERTLAAHQGVLEAIRLRDPDAARQRMQALLDVAQDDLGPALDGQGPQARRGG
jgi:GntR family transcriptional regulator, galactonate operon transcriptional repressor